MNKDEEIKKSEDDLNHYESLLDKDPGSSSLESRLNVVIVELLKLRIMVANLLP